MLEALDRTVWTNWDDVDGLQELEGTRRRRTEALMYRTSFGIEPRVEQPDAAWLANHDPAR